MNKQEPKIMIWSAKYTPTTSIVKSCLNLLIGRINHMHYYLASFMLISFLYNEILTRFLHFKILVCKLLKGL